MFSIFIYPSDLKARPTLWLWDLRDVVIAGLGALLSVIAMARTGAVFPLILTVLFAFLSIRLDGPSVLDFLRCAVCFLFLRQQYYEWRDPGE